MSRKRRRSQSIDKTPQQAQIESLSHDGWGIARPDGKTTFIQGALPGETVEYIYTERKKDYDKGICQQVLTPAVERVAPPCEHYSVCGGCSFQHYGSDNQIAHKQNVLMENLLHIGGVTPTKVLLPLVGDRLAYRHKARLSVKYVHKKDAVLVGFRERLSGRFIADIQSCQILHPAVGLLIQPLRELIASLSNYASIAQIEVAIGENKSIFILRHLEAFEPQDLEKLRSFASSHNIFWYLQPGGEHTIHPLDTIESDWLTYSLPEWQLNFKFKPTDFTQVNPSVNQKMVALAIELLDVTTSDRVLDLFCGLGNFTLPLATKSLEVVGIEGCDKMTQRAAMNAADNNINNVSFFQANLFETVKNAQWFAEKFDKILLDPPRAGAKEICEQMAQLGAKKIVYVSCQTTTLARDAKILAAQGYELSEAGVMDMFPHTAHVESIAVFNKIS